MEAVPFEQNCCMCDATGTPGVELLQLSDDCYMRNAFICLCVENGDLRMSVANNLMAVDWYCRKHLIRVGQRMDFGRNISTYFRKCIEGISLKLKKTYVPLDIYKRIGEQAREEVDKCLKSNGADRRDVEVLLKCCVCDASSTHHTGMRALPDDDAYRCSVICLLLVHGQIRVRRAQNLVKCKSSMWYCNRHFIHVGKCMKFGENITEFLQMIRNCSCSMKIVFPTHDHIIRVCEQAREEADRWPSTCTAAQPIVVNQFVEKRNTPMVDRIVFPTRDHIVRICEQAWEEADRCTSTNTSPLPIAVNQFIEKRNTPIINRVSNGAPYRLPVRILPLISRTREIDFHPKVIGTRILPRVPDIKEGICCLCRRKGSNSFTNLLQSRNQRATLACLFFDAGVIERDSAPAFLVQYLRRLYCTAHLVELNDHMSEMGWSEKEWYTRVVAHAGILLVDTPTMCSLTVMLNKARAANIEVSDSFTNGRILGNGLMPQTAKGGGMGSNFQTPDLPLLSAIESTMPIKEVLKRFIKPSPAEDLLTPKYTTVTAKTGQANAPIEVVCIDCEPPMTC